MRLDGIPKPGKKLPLTIVEAVVKEVTFFVLVDTNVVTVVVKTSKLREETADVPFPSLTEVGNGNP